jgi:hypothetical protein
MAGLRGLELANVIFRKPLKCWADSLRFAERSGDLRPFAGDLQQRSYRNDICRFESSHPSQAVVSSHHLRFSFRLAHSALSPLTGGLRRHIKSKRTRFSAYSGLTMEPARCFQPHAYSLGTRINQNPVSPGLRSDRIPWTVKPSLFDCETYADACHGSVSSAVTTTTGARVSGRWNVTRAPKFR